VGGLAFVAGVLFVLMGMGHWQEDNNPGWLAASIIVAVCTVIGGLKALFKRGK
jgi:UDP-N-acetylmuramyl pentapeptide phosphotransferase/UDP-N-acetylglucosamine-1-phosphate transferase